MSPSTDLFRPFQLGSIPVANRIAMAPLTRSRVGDDGVPGDLQATYYAQRATAGLLISEATNISRQGRGYAYTPGIWTDEQVTGWRKVTDAVHTAGGKIVNQLWHVGRYSHVSLQEGGEQPVGPSTISAEGNTFTEAGFEPVSKPRALTTGEIPGIVAQYRHAAECAKRAGFDGVEVHSANSYLLDQFIRDSVNERTDAYGGSIENRCRLTLEAVDAALAVWGDPGRVGIRLSPTTPDAGNTPPDSDVMGTYNYLLGELSQRGIAYVHLVEGATAGTRDVPEGVDLQTLRRRFDGPYIANNRYTLNMAIQARVEGTAEMIAFGRPFIANPDLVERFQKRLPLNEVEQSTVYGGGAHGYTDYPTLVDIVQRE